MFSRYILRTTDADAGRRFYSEAIGLALPEGKSESSILEAWPLHEQARAKGAPAHWLGQIAVDDVEATASRLVELGSERLGPTIRPSDGVAFTTLRDPLGAIVGARSGPSAAADAPVAWHHLSSRDGDRAWALYSELFGWKHTSTLELGELGRHRLFAWKEGGESVGSMSSGAARPGVHPHWLYCFPVDDVRAACARVIAGGGKAMDPIELPDGACVAACEDPQGAAFGLHG